MVNFCMTTVRIKVGLVFVLGFMFRGSVIKLAILSGNCEATLQQLAKSPGIHQAAKAIFL